MANIGKRITKAREGIDPEARFTVVEAVKALRERATAKFDETVEMSLNLGIDPRHADQTVRGAISLPNGTGKSLRVAVFAKGDKAEEATKAGADIVGAEDLVASVQNGEIDFERVIATPDMMPLVGRLGKVLGPRGLMPNPKLGTVTADVAEAVKAAKSGQVQFRAEKTGIIHAGVGKASFGQSALEQNVRAFYAAITAAKPSGVKGVYIKRVSISSTMGPGIGLDIADLAAGGGSDAAA